MNRIVAICLLASCLLGVTPVYAEEIETVSVHNFYAGLVGDWTGTYTLWTHPEAEPQESVSNAKFLATAQGAYYVMTYDWERAGTARAGVFLFGGHGSNATAAWGDSFHMLPDPMQCTGELSEDGNKLVVLGSYAAGSGPDWGWRTEFTRLGPSSLLMEAYNITPEGLEAIAVRAELSRTE